MITPSCDEIFRTREGVYDHSGLPRDLCRCNNADFAAAPPADPFDHFSCWRAWRGGENGALLAIGDPILRATCKNGTVTLEGTVNKTVKTDKPLTVLHPRCSAVPRTAAQSAAVHRRFRRLLRVCDARLRGSRRSKSSAAHGVDFDPGAVRQRSSRTTTSTKIVLVVNMKTDSVMENYGNLPRSKRAWQR